MVVKHLIKKCPTCETHLSLDARKCEACGQRVGPVNKKTGIAMKAPDVWSYVVCVISWAAFIGYVWWAFF